MDGWVWVGLGCWVVLYDLFPRERSLECCLVGALQKLRLEVGARNGRGVDPLRPFLNIDFRPHFVVIIRY
jgi:hypothetical protein